MSFQAKQTWTARVAGMLPACRWDCQLVQVPRMAASGRKLTSTEDGACTEAWAIQATEVSRTKETAI